MIEGHDGIHILELGNKVVDSDSLSSVPMIRFLKVEMEAPSENENGLYCTITKVGVYGTSMHEVMRNSLKGLGSTNTHNNQTASDIIAQDADFMASVI